MRLAVAVFGRELVAVELQLQDQVDGERGDAVSTVVGFVQSPGDQRWQPGLEP